MSTKEETVQKLIKAGYQAKLEKSGIVTVYYKNKAEYEHLNNTVKDFLRGECDYHGSFGIKPVERTMVAQNEE